MASITPIFAVSSGQDNNATTTEDFAGCQTTALAAGVVYWVLYSANAGGQAGTDEIEVRLRFGDTMTASDGDELAHTSAGTSAVNGPAAGTGCWGSTFVTGNGSDVVKFTHNLVNAGGRSEFDDGVIIAIPVTIIPVNQDRFYAGSNAATVQLTDAATGAFAAVGGANDVVNATFDLGAGADDFLVIYNVEGKPEDGASAGAARVQFWADGAQVGSDRIAEWQQDSDYFQFSYAEVLTGLSGSTTFAILGASRSQAEADFRRGQITVIRMSRFEYAHDENDTGANTNTTTDATLISQAFSPTVTQYVISIGSALIGASTAVGQLYASLRNSTGPQVYQSPISQKLVDTGYDSGSDQKSVLMMGVQQLTGSSSNTMELRYNRAGSNDCSIGKLNDGTTGSRSTLIVFGLEADTTDREIVVDPIDIDVEVAELDIPIPPKEVVLDTPIDIGVVVAGLTLAGAVVPVPARVGNNLFRRQATTQQNLALYTVQQSDNQIDQALTDIVEIELFDLMTKRLLLDEARSAVVRFFDDAMTPITAPQDIILPPMPKFTWFIDATTGGQILTVMTEAGGGIALVAATPTLVYSDGTTLTQLYPAP